MAYMVLDTTTNIIWHYKKATSNAWLRLNLLPSDTASILTNYYRSGRTGIIQASDVPTLNQNTTGSAATLTTSRTFQTNLASTSTASFNGSANVTPGVTGTLPVANGGTGASTFTAGSVVFAGTSGTYTQDNSNFFWNNTNKNLGIGTTSPSAGYQLQVTGANSRIFLLNSSSGSTGNYSQMAFGHGSAINENAEFIRYNNTKRFSIFNGGGDIFFSTNYENDYRYDLFIESDNGKVGIGTESPSEALHVVGNGRFTAVGAGAYSNDLNITSTGVLTTGVSSDETFKYNINPITYGLSTILQLKPVSFQWKKGDEHDLGFIAQDAVNIIPEAVDTFWDSSLLFRSNTIIPILTKAIQEQQALIKALEQRIINLENK
jgi:hypothetical protein